MSCGAKRTGCLALELVYNQFTVSKGLADLGANKMTITRETLKALRTDLAEAFLQVSRKHGVAIDLGTIRFSATEASGKLSIVARPQTEDAGTEESPADSGKEIKARIALQSSAVARLCDAEPSWLDKTVTLRGADYIVIGLLPSRPKNPMLIRRVSTGKTFIATVADIRRALTVAAGF